MQDNKSMTVQEFDVAVARLSKNLIDGQQEVQDLANEAVYHASIDSDFTFFTKLYKALPASQKANKLKGWIEQYGGCKYESEGKNDGQFKKDHSKMPDPLEAIKAKNAWWNFSVPKKDKPFNAVDFFNRHTKTIGKKGADDMFNPMDDAQQQAVDLLIRSIKNEGFDINDPQINPMTHPADATEELREAA